MDTFYKYTSNFGADFFINPTIKISNPINLNDPFESQAGDNLIYVAKEALSKNEKDIEDQEIRNILNDLLNANGIFSVSETPRNPLMWAHYADEHAGLCIGFDEYIFASKRIPDGSRYKIAGLKPNKINYDNYRFDRQVEITDKDTMLQAIRNHLLTKSDDWIYEKEHRWIIPFSFATHVKINRKSNYMTSRLDASYHIDAFLADALEEKDLEEIETDIFKIKRDTRELIILALATFGCVSFLFNVKPKNIKSIHIGLRVSDDDVKSIYSTIKNEKNKLSHIKLFKFRLSSKRFELLPDIVDEEYISKLSIK